MEIESIKVILLSAVVLGLAYKFLIAGQLNMILLFIVIAALGFVITNMRKDKVSWGGE